MKPVRRHCHLCDQAFTAHLVDTDAKGSHCLDRLFEIGSESPFKHLIAAGENSRIIIVCPQCEQDHQLRAA